MKKVSIPRRTDPQGAHVAARAVLHALAGRGGPWLSDHHDFAATRCLQAQPDLADPLAAQDTARVYVPQRPAAEKQGLTVGMAMTEKPGRLGRSRQHHSRLPGWVEGPGQAYELVGHKFFVSAPMCDFFLTLAQAPGGLSCFLLPRWRPDGEKNPMQVLRLKKKCANASNASSETELRGALAWMVGPEGRGVATIIEMVALTRFDCMLGSSSGLRMATSQAIDHCAQRSAFGRKLIDQPIMQDVLADLAIETEAAIAMSFRLARALDNRGDEHEDRLVRLCTALGKYWICKRGAAHAAEAMECVGGGGVMEDFADAAPLPGGAGQRDLGRQRQCAMSRRSPRREEFAGNAGGLFQGSGNCPWRPSALGPACRRLESKPWATCLISNFAPVIWWTTWRQPFRLPLLVRHAPAALADAFCESRLGATSQHHYGALGEAGSAGDHRSCCSALRRIKRPYSVASPFVVRFRVWEESPSTPNLTPAARLP